MRRRLAIFASLLPLGATAAADAPPQISVSGGDYQQLLRTGMPAVAAFQPISVRATGPTLAPLQGLAVTFGWSSTNPKARCYINPDQGVATVSVRTGPDGVAVLAALQGQSLVCSQADGEIIVTATAQGVQSAAAHLMVGPLADSITAAVEVGPLNGGTACLIKAFAWLNQPRGSAPPYPLSFITMDVRSPSAGEMTTSGLEPDGTATPIHMELLAGEHASLTASMAAGPAGNLSSSAGGDCPSQTRPSRRRESVSRRPPIAPLHTRSGEPR